MGKFRTSYPCRECKHDKGKCIGHARTGSHKNCFEQRVYTNADRIRAMSDEELAKYLFNFQVNSVCGWIKAGGQGGKTVPEMLDWLRQPKEDNQ